MKEYLQSIIKILKQFSVSLDVKTILIDQPWVHIDDDNNFQKFIFKNNHELIKSNNGIVTVGKWEYIPNARSLLIDRITDKILLNQEFIENGILVLKYDGFSDRYFLLINEKIIPDLNIEKYLKNIYYDKYNITKIITTNNEEFEISKGTKFDKFPLIGHVVLQNGQLIDKDCILISKKSGIHYHIKNGKIFKKSIILNVLTKDNRKLFIESFYYGVVPQKTFSRGDIVRINEKDFVEDGVYKLGPFRKIKVENGIIK